MTVSEQNEKTRRHLAKLGQNIPEDCLLLFAALDERLANGAVRVAIEGGSAAGKTTLGRLLNTVYGAAVFHTDDFFLRPAQRTPARYAEIGGNMDRERFEEEVLQPLCRGEAVRYRPFDCGTMTLGREVCVAPTPLTVIEGAYSMHPALAPYYDFSVFLDVSPDLQKARIRQRNTPAMAKRFFEEWIPLEEAYFSATAIRERCDMCIAVL